MVQRSQDKFAKQEAILRAIERLEQRDTQHAAASDLCKLIRDIDSNALGTLLHVMSVQTTKTSQFARVELLRVLALLTTPLCTMRQAVLAPPTFNKLVGLVVGRLADADSRVREAAGEACGVVAEQLMDLWGPGAAVTAGDPASNPLLGAVLQAVIEQNRDVQAAAAAALCAMADHLQPISPPLLRQLLKALDSSSFPAKAELWPAFAHLEGGSRGAAAEAHGLVRSSTEVVQGHIGFIIGSAAGSGKPASGLLGALSVPEWQARKAAAETLQALALALCGDWDGSGSSGVGTSNSAVTNTVVQALAAAKYDRVKPAREAMQAALATVQAIPGGSGGCPPTASAPPARVSPGARTRTQRPHTTAGSMQSGSPASQALLSASWSPGKSSAPANQAGSGEQFHIAALKSPIMGPPAPHGACVPPTSLQELHAEQQRMAAAIHLLTVNTNSALEQMHQHITALECSIQQMALERQQAGGGGGRPGVATAGPSAQCCSPAGWAQPVASGSPQVPQAKALAQASKGGSEVDSPTRALADLADLRASHDALVGSMKNLQSSLAGPLPTTPAAAQLGEKPATSEGAQGGGEQSMEELYSGLLQGSPGGGGSFRNELKLLRTMNRTGAVWGDLSSDTAQALLGVLQHLLEGNSALAKVLPWLWPLADEGGSSWLGMEQKLDLLRVLTKCPVEDESLAEKVSMLVSTLKACWGVTGTA